MDTLLLIVRQSKNNLTAVNKTLQTRIHGIDKVRERIQRASSSSLLQRRISMEQINTRPSFQCSLLFILTFSTFGTHDLIA